MVVDPMKINVPVGEAGYSGTPIYSGYLDTEEWVSELRGLPLFTTMEKMRVDAIISSVENGYFLPIEQANMSIDYSHSKELNDNEKNIIEFLKKQFGNINISEFLHNALTFLPNGFSLFEPVYERTATAINLLKLAPRMAKTIMYWWPTAHGDLKGVTQFVFTYSEDGKSGAFKQIEIPAEKLLLITNKKEGGNFEGRSLYRPFYREWKIKDKALKVSVIAIDRTGAGVPYARMDGEASEEQMDAAEDAFKDLQASENSYMVMKAAEIGIAFNDPKALTALFNDVVKYCDEAIAKSAFQMFMSLGTSASGSRALGTTFEGLYYQALEGIASIISNAVSIGVVRKLIDWNFGPQEYYPSWNIQIKQDMSAILQTIGTLKQRGVIRGNKDIENWVFEYYGIPATTKENELEFTKATGDIVPAENVPAPVAASDRRGGPLQLSDVCLNRKPTALEDGIINFTDTADRLNALKKTLSGDLRRIVQPAAIDAAKAIGKGEKLYNVKIQVGNKVADTFKKYYKKMKEIGSTDVKSELLKQDKGKKLTDRLTMADPVQADFDKWANEQANVDSEILTADMKKALAQYYGVGVARGLAGAALSDFILNKFIEEVGQRYEDAAARITGSYGMVREMSAAEMSDMIDGKVRSEIFDNRLCSYCEGEDGKEYYLNDKGEYVDEDGNEAPDLSNPETNPCEGFSGSGKCRGMYLYLLKK